MNTITLIALFMNWILYYATDGLKDAVLWSKKGAKAFPFNEHIIFGFERLAVFGIAFCSFFLKTPQDLLLNVVVWTAFPLFHNGMYYWGRNKIDRNVYPKQFWAEPSNTSTATFNFSKMQRIVLAIIGFVLFSVLLATSAQAQTRKEYRDLARKVRKENISQTAYKFLTGQINLSPKADTVYIPKIVEKIKEVPKEIIRKEIEYQDTCIKSRYELRHDRKQDKRADKQELSLAKVALQKAKQERIESERLAKIRQRQVEDSLSKIIKLTKEQNKGKFDSLKTVRKTSKDDLRETRIENHGWNWWDWIKIAGLMALAFLAGKFFGRILKFIGL